MALAASSGAPTVLPASFPAEQHGRTPELSHHAQECRAGGIVRRIARAAVRHVSRRARALGVHRRAAVVEPRAGTDFSAFGGVLTGRLLHVEPKRLIAQTWRSTNFPASAIDSVLVLTFWKQADGVRIELVQVNVADEDFAGVCQGWEKYYWTPWRDYLSRS